MPNNWLERLREAHKAGEIRGLADFHVHTKEALGDKFNGAVLASRIVEKAPNHNVSVFAITNYHSVKGVQRGLEAAKASEKTHVIPGMEIICVYKGMQVHIVGLGIDHKHPEIVEFEKAVENAVEVQKHQLRVEIRQFGVAQFLKNHNIPVKQGASMPSEEALDKAFKTERQMYPVQGAINLIHRLGGIAVWAHPPVSRSMSSKDGDGEARTLKVDWKKLRSTMWEMTEFGLDGMEIGNPLGGSSEKVKDDCRVKLRGFAEKIQNLPVFKKTGKRVFFLSAGSDEHVFPDKNPNFGKSAHAVNASFSLPYFFNAIDYVRKHYYVTPAPEQISASQPMAKKPKPVRRIKGE